MTTASTSRRSNTRRGSSWNSGPLAASLFHDSLGRAAVLGFRITDGHDLDTLELEQMA